ncbi:MAG: Hsp33 family molecular chaperone HslO [Myxococcota bacterium]|nr:Hsp33 family molecular chaperone HslO [Myxococcota bacterium]
MANTTSRPRNQCVRGLAVGRSVRLIAVQATALADELRTAHDAGPVGTAVLGRMACAALLLSVTLKERQQIGVQVNGDGPMGEAYAVADWLGRVRVTVADPKVQLADGLSLDEGIVNAVGQGRLTVIKQLTDGQPYKGIVPLVSGRIADDLAHYLLTSEQVHSAVALGEIFDKDGVVSVGGLMLQAMPGANGALLDDIIERFEALPPVGELFATHDDPKHILESLADDFECVDEREVRFHCPCSREQFARRLCALGESSLKSLTEDDDEATAICHFCGARYVFTREQLNALLYGARMYDQAEQGRGDHD